MIRALQFSWTTLDQTFGSLDTLKILLSPIRTYATKLIMGIDKEKTPSNHTHVLIASNKDLSYSDLKKTFTCSVGDYQIVDDNEGVTKYITKFVGKDVDYEFEGEF